MAEREREWHFRHPVGGTDHVHLGDGAQQDNGEHGDGEPEGERVRHVEAEPAEAGGEQHHEQHGRPHERGEEEQQQDERARQHGQLHAAEAHEQHEAAGERAAEARVIVLLVLQMPKFNFYSLQVDFELL